MIKCLNIKTVNMQLESPILTKEKAAQAYAIHPLLQRRYSPRAFSGEPVEEGAIHQLFEAVRWAPSSYNEQPWSFIIATPEEESFQMLLDLLNEGNRVWAARAGLLGLAVARKHFSRNGRPNRHAWHDVGQALAYLTFQAMDLGLYVHQMAGFDPDRSRQAFSISEDYEAVTAFAVGYVGDSKQLPENQARSERSPQKRRHQEKFVFRGKWGDPLA